MIKQKFRITKKFYFQFVSKDEVKKLIKDLKSNKSLGGEIQTKLLKECEFTFDSVSK